MSPSWFTLRNLRRVFALSLVALALTGCGVGHALFPAPNFGSYALTSGQYAELQAEADPANPTADAGLVALKEAGYTPVIIGWLDKTYWVVYLACGDKSIEDCQHKAKPTNDKPFVMVHLAGDTHLSPLAFNGQFHLEYPTPKNNNENYSLICVIALPAPPSAASPAPSPSASASPAKVVSIQPSYTAEFSNIGNTFEALTYGINGDQTMEQTKQLANGELWQCNSTDN